MGTDSKLLNLLPFLMLLSAAFGFHYNPMGVVKDISKLDKEFGNKVKSGIRNMEIDISNDYNAIPPHIRRPSNQMLMMLKNHVVHTNNHWGKAEKHTLLTDTFMWKSCGPKDQVVNVKSLTIEPQPLVFPGTINIGFDVEFEKTVPDDSSLKAKIQLEFESGSTWIQIPCMGNIGSCEYDDLCFQAKKITQCPQALKDAGIECKCPFKRGDYKLDNMSIMIDASVFLSGNYRGNVTLNNQSSGQLACYAVTFSVD